jgi:hypothetical protein
LQAYSAFLANHFWQHRRNKVAKYPDARKEVLTAGANRKEINLIAPKLAKTLN